jgi:hypothetical protein
MREQFDKPWRKKLSLFWSDRASKTDEGLELKWPERLPRRGAQNPRFQPISRVASAFWFEPYEQDVSFASDDVMSL